jgi:putative membrane protein
MQLERTSLAWQRTALGLVAASLAAGRGLEDMFGITAWGVAGIGVTAAVGLFVSANRRYRSGRRHLSRVDPDSLPTGARTVLATAALTALLGGAALLFLVTSV